MTIRVKLYDGKPQEGKTAPYTPKFLTRFPSGKQLLDCMRGRALEVSTLHFYAA